MQHAVVIAEPPLGFAGSTARAMSFLKPKTASDVPDGRLPPFR